METTYEETEWEEVKTGKCCKNCRHFAPYVYSLEMDVNEDTMDSDYGECRRFPPKLVSAEESGFPIVQELQWCGEFDI